MIKIEFRNLQKKFCPIIEEIIAQNGNCTGILCEDCPFGVVNSGEVEKCEQLIYNEVIDPSSLTGEYLRQLAELNEANLDAVSLKEEE